MRARQYHGCAAPEELEALLACNPLLAISDSTSPERRAAVLRILGQLLAEMEMGGVPDKAEEAPLWLNDLRPNHGAGPGTPMALWSDWHYGEVVDAGEVAGLNRFSPLVARARAQRLVEGILQVCFDSVQAPRYPGFVLCLAGDFLSGDGMVDEITETNASRVAPLLLEVQVILEKAIRKLLEAFPYLYIPCVVGNHGRMSRRPRHKQMVLSNHEWLLYRQLARSFADEPRVHFYIPRMAEALFSLHGHRFCLTHGDYLGLKPTEGVMALAAQAKRGETKLHHSEKMIGRDFDTLLVGHWHTYLPLQPQLIVNGSLKGYCEYARYRLRAVYEPPQQALWFLRPPPFGITTLWPIVLSEPEPAEETAEPPAARSQWFW